MITILMATYNGQRYLEEQIESILAQSQGKWKVVIQDDCSTDRTFEIAQSYAGKYEDKIRAFQRSTPSGSAKNNFASMLKYVDTEYWMTCDQDDIWVPNKIEITLEAMRKLETQYKNIPLLVHTDLMVVNKNKNIIAESMFSYQRLDYKRDSLANILVQNNVTGCTAMMNRQLLYMAESVPTEALMHDWWFALIAAAFGKISFINQSTVLYRQHENNSVGAKSAYSITTIFKRIVRIKDIIKTIDGTYVQAECFLNRYKKKLSIFAVETCCMYIQLPSMNKIKKISTIFKYGFTKTGLVRKIGQIFLV